MRLIESQRSRERRRGGALVSVVAHVSLVALAIVATTRTGDSVEVVDPLPDVIYRVPTPVVPDRTGGATGGGPVVRTEPTTQPREQVTIDVPIVVPDGLPVIDDGPPSFVDTARLGLRRDAGHGGAGDPRRGGGPGADGVWSEHVVDIPVSAHGSNPVPSYPELLRTAGAAGEVTVEFVVDTTGRVRPGTLRIVSSTHELFAISVRRTVPAMRFLPARAQGRTVPQLVRMPFVFEIKP